MRATGLLLIISLFIKLLLAAWLPLSSDEAYYWLWSYFPSLSYYDHPPFVAWLYWLGQPLEALGSAVRWPGVLMGHLCLVVWVQILRPYLNEKSLFWFTLLALLSPLTGPGSIVITPDIPYLFFLSLLIWATLRTRENSQIHWPLLMGALLGLGFLSKYTIVVFVPSALFLFFRDKWSLKRWGSALALGLIGFLLTSWPVWLWNIQNGWLSLNFQIDHGLGAKVWKPSWTIEYVLAQVALIFPSILFFAARSRTAPLWLHAFAWFPLAFFFFTSFRGYAEANWPIAAYLPLIALSVWSAQKFAWAKWTAALWAICLSLVIALIGGIDLLPVDKSKVKIRELFIDSSVLDFAEKHDAVYARSYQSASKLSYELKRPIFKLNGINRFDVYDTLAGSHPENDEFWLLHHTDDQIPKSVFERYESSEVLNLNPPWIARRFTKK